MRMTESAVQSAILVVMCHLVLISASLVRIWPVDIKKKVLGDVREAK